MKDIYNDLYHEIEGWEEEYNLLNNKQYDKLIELRKKNVKKYPDDIQVVLDLCEVYCLNNEYMKSFDKLKELHQNNSNIQSIQYLILETLWGLGKDINEFDWYQTPVILFSNKEVCNICYDLLKGKRKPVPINELYLDLYEIGYTKFNEKELYELLSTDSRFLIRDDDYSMLSSVKRKPKK